MMEPEQACSLGYAHSHPGGLSVGVWSAALKLMWFESHTHTAFEVTATLHKKQTTMQQITAAPKSPKHTTTSMPEHTRHGRASKAEGSYPLGDLD
eukprot:546607-Amphidinium_carterae.1